jgi:hypothetical protein
MGMDLFSEILELLTYFSSAFKNLKHAFSFLSFFLLVGLEFELRASHSQSRHSITQVIPPVHFGQVILKMGISQSIYLDWPPSMTLPISASQVARITGIAPAPG